MSFPLVNWCVSARCVGRNEASVCGQSECLTSLTFIFNETFGWRIRWRWNFPKMGKVSRSCLGFFIYIIYKTTTLDNFQNISCTTAWHGIVTEECNYNETKTLKFIINEHRRPMFFLRDWRRKHQHPVYRSRGTTSSKNYGKGFNNFITFIC